MFALLLAGFNHGLDFISLPCIAIGLIIHHCQDRSQWHCLVNSTAIPVSWWRYIRVWPVWQCQKWINYVRVWLKTRLVITRIWNCSLSFHTWKCSFPILPVTIDGLNSVNFFGIDSDHHQRSICPDLRGSKTEIVSAYSIRCCNLINLVVLIDLTLVEPVFSDIDFCCIVTIGNLENNALSLREPWHSEINLHNVHLDSFKWDRHMR